MTFCNSRMFPGQGYDSSNRRVFLSTVVIFLPAFGGCRWINYSTRGRSSFFLRQKGSGRGAAGAAPPHRYQLPRRVGADQERGFDQTAAGARKAADERVVEN